MTDSKDGLKLLNSEVLSKNEQAALEAVTGSEWKKYTRVAMAALGGIPWVGSVLSAAATLSAEKDQSTTNKIIYLWVQEHEQKLKDLGITLNEVFTRFETLGNEITKRIESDEYLTLVRKTFRQWDQAETIEKKEMLKKLITNSGVVTLAQDDLVRLFLEWISKYHEFHFAVMREIYLNPRITRKQIWQNIRGDIPTDSSAEAHLFKLLINDLSIGEVITQYKNIDSHGSYLKAKPQKRTRTDTLQSPFEDTKSYVLTELGEQFVHYVMNDVVEQLSSGKGDSDTSQ